MKELIFSKLQALNLQFETKNWTTSLVLLKDFAYNAGQDIWNIVEKSSNIGQD